MPTMTASGSVGNLLGQGRAEADGEMLRQAFIEIPAYRALVETRDFNFVVGRRGTGKSALFERVREHYAGQPNTIVIAEKPPEHHSIEFQRLLTRLGSEYRSLRPTSRLVWKGHLLLEAASRTASAYRFQKTPQYKYLRDYLSVRGTLLKEAGIARCVALLRTSSESASHATEIPGKLASTLDIDRLQNAVRELLRELNYRIVVMFDGLDEGWSPDPIATSVIGGLGVAGADFTDAGIDIYPIMFVRDNIFRALAQLDRDFTRHIEGHTLRLHWDETSLFHLVAVRLRVALSISKTENDAKVWNRFAHRDLKDRDGFDVCLHHTLYRPRDILALLNEAYSNALRDDRTEIVPEDIEKSATGISQRRLDDLLKEYEVVFPGLRLFVSLFRGQPAQDTYGGVVRLLDKATEASDYAEPEARDFSLLNSGQEMFTALYSVGFVGVKDPSGSGFIFCHDGASSPLATIEPERAVTIHPCYWKALELQGDTPAEEIVVRINDEYEAPPATITEDFRVKRLGEVLGALPTIPPGREHSADFELWTLRAFRILFAGKLSNIQLKPNPGAVQQRDIVATNMATSGFWRRIYDDYRSRQIVIEVKNYAELDGDDFRQVLGYSGGEYGQFVVVVSRANTENPSESEKTWLREMYHQHKRVILIVPAGIVARCVAKLRNRARKYDYAEDRWNKAIDTLIRVHLSMPQAQRFRKKRHGKR